MNFINTNNFFKKKQFLTLQTEFYCIFGKNYVQYFENKL